MDEYEDDELASNDNDAKRIEKAEKAAATKAWKRKKAANPHSGRQMQGRQQRAWEQPTVQEPREHFPPRAEWARQPSVTSRPPWVAGSCFQCGEMSHLLAMCPKLTKSYPFCNTECVDKPERECTSPEVKLCNSVNADSGNPRVVKDLVIGVILVMCVVLILIRLNWLLNPVYV